MSGKVGRNDPCPCGSGKKYKKCCLNGPSVFVGGNDVAAVAAASGTTFFNNHNHSDGDQVTELYRAAFTLLSADYPQNDECELTCYLEEYSDNGRLCCRMRDRDTGKKISFVFLPDDVTVPAYRREMLAFFSEVKRTNCAEFYKRDGKSYILVQAIRLQETDSEIDLAAYFAEAFLTGQPWF